MHTEDLIYKIIGGKIKDLRTKHDLSQEKLAQEIGLLRTSIVNIEAGRQRAPIHILFKISNIFSVELKELIPTCAEVSSLEKPTTLLNELPKKASKIYNKLKN